MDVQNFACTIAGIDTYWAYEFGSENVKNFISFLSTGCR